MNLADGLAWVATRKGLFELSRRGPTWAIAHISFLGASRQLVESLWQGTERLEWFGGGYPVPGIHLICPHPKRHGEMLRGISGVGTWTTRDGGRTFERRAPDCPKGTPTTSAAATAWRWPTTASSC